MLFGHFEEEGFQTEDSAYTYKIYHSAYGYSVGRRKKPVYIADIEQPLPKTDQKVNSVIGHTKEDEIIALKNRIVVIENWIKKVSESWVMNNQQ